MIAAHGDKLINRLVEGKKLDNLMKEIKEISFIDISRDTYEDLENIATGVFSPLEGFMNREQLSSISESDRLPGGIPWTMPILLDVPTDFENDHREGEDIALRFKDETVGILHLEEIYAFDKKKLVEHVFGTTDKNHPGVANVYAMQERFLGGKIDLLKKQDHPFRKYHLTPKETRALFREKGWKTAVGFQTRNVPHLGHEFVQKTALAFVDGVFINPVIGKKKPGDFLDEVILNAYAVLIANYYLPERAALSILNTRMRYGGPKEAIFHAIARKNFGCTHFIVGRDHAGVGNYYGPYEAQEIFSEFPDLLITPIFFREFFYCKKCYSAVTEKQCPHEEEHRLNFSGTKIRQLLAEKKRPAKELMRPEVADYIINQEKLFVE